MKKIITLSILLIVFVSITGCSKEELVLNQDIEALSTDNIVDSTVNSYDQWEVYNSEYGFQIEYPQDWEIFKEIDAKDLNRPSAVVLDLSFGNGTRGNGYDGELFFKVYDRKIADIETTITTIGKQFKDRQESRENILVNGISAVKVTIITPSIPSWVYKAIIIENGSYVYSMSNGAIDSDNFNLFYNSFKIN